MPINHSDETIRWTDLPARPRQKLVVLIGQPKACALAVRNVRAMRRLTNLVARLRQ